MKSHDDLIAGLSDSRSPKRRSAARALRKLGDPRACSHLLEAVKRELCDPRTWETQYQMIMALGFCGCRESLPYLKQLLTEKPKCEPAAWSAISHAIVRLGSKDNSDPSVAIELIDQNAQTGLDKDGLTCGVFEAIAMMKMQFDDSTADRLIEFVETYRAELPTHSNFIPVYAAIASAGWNGNRVRPFLQKSLSSPNQQLVRAAEHALQGKYFKLNPL